MKETIHRIFDELLPGHEITALDGSGPEHVRIFTGDGKWIKPTHVVYDEDGLISGQGVSAEEAMANAIAREFKAERKAHKELRLSVEEWREATSALMVSL